MKYFKKSIPYLIIILIVCIRLFVISPVRVQGLSMYPTLDDREILLLKKYDHSFKRFDIIVFQYQNDKLIKRVIGLPGDSIKIEDNQLYINGEAVKDPMSGVLTNDFDLISLGFATVPKGYYFVLGDNRGNSTDSRSIGLVSEKQILGSTSFSLWPFKSIK